MDRDRIAWYDPSDIEDVFEEYDDNIDYFSDEDYFPLPSLSELEGDEEDPWDY